jgi:hypothetical protein
MGADLDGADAVEAQVVGVGLLIGGLSSHGRGG